MQIEKQYHAFPTLSKQMNLGGKSKESEKIQLPEIFYYITLPNEIKFIEVSQASIFAIYTKLHKSGHASSLQILSSGKISRSSIPDLSEFLLNLSIYTNKDVKKNHLEKG